MNHSPEFAAWCCLGSQNFRGPDIPIQASYDTTAHYLNLLFSISMDIQIVDPIVMLPIVDTQELRMHRFFIQVFLHLK